MFASHGMHHHLGTIPPQGGELKTSTAVSGHAGNARVGVWVGSRWLLQRVRLPLARRSVGGLALRFVAARDALPVLPAALAPLPS